MSASAWPPTLRRSTPVTSAPICGVNRWTWIVPWPIPSSNRAGARVPARGPRVHRLGRYSPSFLGRFLGVIEQLAASAFGEGDGGDLPWLGVRLRRDGDERAALHEPFQD